MELYLSERVCVVVAGVYDSVRRLRFFIVCFLCRFSRQLGRVDLSGTLCSRVLLCHFRAIFRASALAI